MGVVVEQIGSKTPQQMNASEGIEGDAVAAVGGDSVDAIAEPIRKVVRSGCLN